MNPRPLSIWAAICLFGCLLSCSTRPAETARKPWHEASTARFRIWTDGEPEAARELVADLERFHQVVMAETTAEEREAAPPLRIFLARNRESFVSLTGMRDLAGAFIATIAGNYAIVDGSPVGGRAAEGRSVRSILFHEYTHSALAQSNSLVPSWYNEGFATYLETTEFRTDGSYTVGCPPRYRTAWKRGRSWVPMERVLTSERVSELVGPWGGTDSYAQSWYAVHYFNADPTRKQQLAQYLRSWAEGVPVPEAVQSGFGLSMAELDTQLQNHAVKPRFSCVAITPRKALAVPRIELRPISTGDAHRHIGELVLTTMGPSEAAFEVLERAGKLQPNDAPTLLVLGRAHLARAVASQRGTQADLSAAERYLEQARARSSGTAGGFLLEGQLRAARTAQLVEQKQPFAEELLATRKAFRSAVRADETLTEAYVGLGKTYLIDDNGSEEPIVALEAAAYLAPLATDIALTLGKIHLRRKSALQALQAFEYALRWSHKEAQRNDAQRGIDQLRADAARPEPAAAAPEATPETALEAAAED